ncbi:MAG: hypothetical protein QNK23_07610 [Crocinitomicaceae bacterium]|nr:hypothetical protein [Crocinitomicaceae bacterium]
MKILAIIGASLGVIALLLGLYLQFVIVDAAEAAEASWDFARNMPGDAYYGSVAHMNDMAAMDRKTDFGVIVMAAGLLAFLVSIVPVIKKQHIAWIGVGLGVLALLLGAAYGTHMFS